MIGIVLSVIGILVFLGLSARWNWWRIPKKGIPILMYHKIGNAPEGSQLKKLWVSNEKFEAQMEYLKKQGYSPIVFKDLYQYWDKNVSLPEKPILITFDDGYANNYENAFPILKKYNFPATLFVVVQTVGWDNKWHNPESESRIPMVSWNQLKELKDAGWEIGSHTMNHPNLPKLPLKEVSVEMEKSRSVIGEFLGETPDTFAYPYGAGEDDEQIRKKAQEAGYRIAVGVHAGKWTLDNFKKSPFNLPRVFVRGEENLFDFCLQLSRGQSRF
ncbi:MAG: polysaccharide deacetylase family protein [Elusimicrobiota bacterium]